MKILFCLLLILGQVAQVDAKKKASAARLIEAIEHYRNQPEVDWAIERKVRSDLLNQTTTSEGHFYYARDVFQLQFPDEIALFDGKNFWLINQMEKEGPRQVTRSAPDRSNNILLDIFQLRKDSKSKVFQKVGENRFELVKKAGDAIKNVVVELNAKDQLKSISYVDDLKSETTIQFLSEKLLDKKTSSHFQFKKMKTDQVSDY